MRERSEVGWYLENLRCRHRETRIQMAKKLDISISYLSNIEIGKRCVSKKVFDLLCSLYNLSEKDIEELNRAIIKTNKIIHIDISDFSNDQVDFILQTINSLNTTK